MSLLLDALKRAEQEKLARAPAESAATNAPPSRAPAATPPGLNSLELQPLSGTPIPGSRPEPSPQSAQVVFSAKSGTSTEPRGRGMFWATIGAISIVLVAAGAYVWYSVTSLTPKSSTVTRTRPIQPPPGMPPSSMPPLDDALATGPASMPSARLPAPAPAPVEPPPKSGPAVVAPVAPEDPITRVLRERAAPAAPVRLDRSTDAPRRVPAEVSAGYESLRQGNFPAARRNYLAAIANDPTNVDAHLGLATVEAGSGNRTVAAMEYRRVLDLDSRNPTALAALASLAEYSRPEALEAQLRAELTRFPESAAMHFTLGNLLSAQSRWNEAQAEYYEAHRLDPAGADVMYNLAVSLDHLGQTRVAAGFYARALEARSAQPTQFDPAAAARRLAEIR